MIYAKVIADSVSPGGVRLTTLETQAPKFIDAEFEKHRMLSSNSSSSRAIPVGDVGEAYLPSDIRKAQKGMQGYERVDEEVAAELVKRLYTRYKGVVDFLDDYKGVVHKQHLNRYVEPWMLQKKVVTATEWDNFFSLRLATDAQPEMQELARCMKKAMDDSSPMLLRPGQYHLPYYNTSELMELDPREDYKVDEAIKCSVARCARVSYNNHDGSNPDVTKDLALYKLLLSSRHMSPFEHVATPMVDMSASSFGNMFVYIGNGWERGVSHMDSNTDFWSGNFKGWIQQRKIVE